MIYSTVPERIVSTLLASTIVSRSELDHIRSRREPSRYQGVYLHVHGSRYRPNTRYTFRARVFKFFELGTGFESAENAARAIVAFYKHHFGDKWVGAFRNRKAPAWKVSKVRNSCSVGYSADLFVRGSTLQVKNGDSALWPDMASAKRAARTHMAELFAAERQSLPIPAPGLVFWRT
jgi:hypothetical protein